MKSNKNEMWKIYLGVMFSACICGKAQCTTSCSPCTNMDGAVYCEKNCPPAYFEIELLLTACNTSVINTTTSPSELTTPNGLPVSENEKQSTPSSDLSTTSIDSAVGGDEAIASLVICAPCDNACADCSGPGPENCTLCAKGYNARGYNAEGYNAEGNEAGLTMRSISCVILSGAYPSTVDSTPMVAGVTSGLLMLLVVLTIGLLLRKRRRRHREIMGDTVVGASSTESARAPNATSSDNPEVPQSASADTLNDHNFTTRRQQYRQMSSESLPESQASLARCAQNESSNAYRPVQGRREARRRNSFAGVPDQFHGALNNKPNRYSDQSEYKNKKRASGSPTGSSQGSEILLHVPRSDYSSGRSERNKNESALPSHDTDLFRFSDSTSPKKKRIKSFEHKRRRPVAERRKHTRAKSYESVLDPQNCSAADSSQQVVLDWRRQKDWTSDKTENTAEVRIMSAENTSAGCSRDVDSTITTSIDSSFSETDSCKEKASFNYHGKKRSSKSSGYSSDDSFRPSRSKSPHVNLFFKATQNTARRIERLQTDRSSFNSDFGQTRESIPLRTSDCVSDLEGLSLSKPEIKPSLENSSSAEFVSVSTQTATTSEGEGLQPMLSNEWQFCQEFSSSGGILRGEHSDVVLKVPKGAIDIGEYEKIRGAVFTDLPSAQRKLKLPEDEMIASPIIEYDAKEGLSFRDRLEISLPHFLPADFNEGSVKVYMFDRDTGGSLRVRKLRPLDKSNLQRDGSESLENFDVYYFGEDNLLLILVKHFTGYFCTFDCKEKFSPPVLHLKLYANHLETLRGRRRVTVCLKAWDSRMKIRDFTEADQMSLHDQQLMLIEEVTLGRLQPEIVDMASVALGMVVELTEEDEELWMHHRDRRGEITDPAECVIPVNRFVPCKCQQPYPQVRKWHLLNKAGVTPDVFECSLFVGYVETADEQQSFPLKFLTKTERLHFLISIQKSGEALDVSSNAEGSGRNKKLCVPQIVNNLAYEGDGSVSEPQRAAGPVAIFKNVQNLVFSPDGHKSSSDKREASTRPTYSSHPEKIGAPESTPEPSGTARENGVGPSPPFPQEDRSLPPPTQASPFRNDDVVEETEV